MSMPKLPDKREILSREEALNLIITSIAMEEVALSNLMEAESKKIKFAVDSLACDKRKLDKILDINRSVEDVIEKLTDMQIILKNKLNAVIRFSEKISKPCDEKEEQPCSNPKHYIRNNCCSCNV